MAKRAISEKALKIFDYIRDKSDDNITANDIAIDLGLDVRAVNATITMALAKKGFVERVPAYMELEDGTKKDIKLIKMTEAGFDYNHAEAVAADRVEE